MSPLKTVMASAVVEDEFEGRAAIHDLSKLLGSVSALSSPTMEFGEKQFIFRSGKNKLTFWYSSENVVVAPPAADFEVFEDAVCILDLPWTSIERIIRTAGTLQLPDVVFRNEGKNVLVSATDTADATSNNLDVEVRDDFDGADFKMVIKVDNMKLLPADYVISLSDKGVAHFKSEKVQYWIATTAG